ncbi:MAG: hypothetical protein IJD62_06990 [Oscillospiraceae bacterium]|nr:hypothetical protein [Oscillospiraceae bacterium]MBQ2998734.1 hypothetical protein [Oscillospiraceae bacterium]MBQ3561536.1 hypothetical protein [Oscillospiraceae bacterium]MBQ4118420.1 hypothetical protein [Oscillospiraceae bacterium]MBQ6802598.1 hypothetical protein [Oscillospiraceae bacterium]
MNNSKGYKPPIPHNGKKVNDWETLRPYVEMAAPPLTETIASKTEEIAKINPKWGFGYQAEVSGANSTNDPNKQ